MNVISKNIIQNKIKNIQQNIFTEVKNTPNDTVNITPYLNYVKDLPPSNLPSTKKKIYLMSHQIIFMIYMIILLQ